MIVKTLSMLCIQNYTRDIEFGNSWRCVYIHTSLELQLIQVTIKLDHKRQS